MACASCLRRRRKLMVAGGHIMTLLGRPIPRRVLDVMVGVQCRQCGFTGDGVTFGWLEVPQRGFCPKCRSVDLTPGTARLT